MSEQEPKSFPWIWVGVVIIVIAAGYFAWSIMNKTEVATPVATPAPVKTTPAATTPAAVATPVATPTPTTPATTAWKTFSNDGRLLFDYPGDWFVEYKSYMYTIANKQSCLDLPLDGTANDGCQVVTIWYAMSGSAQVRGQDDENNLKTNPNYTKGSIASGDIIVNTYSADTPNRSFAAFFHSSQYSVSVLAGSGTELDDIIAVANKILSTVKLK